MIGSPMSLPTLIHVLIPDPAHSGSNECYMPRHCAGSMRAHGSQAGRAEHQRPRSTGKELDWEAPPPEQQASSHNGEHVPCIAQHLASHQFLQLALPVLFQLLLLLLLLLRGLHGHQDHLQVQAERRTR
jgi:hypothetical protein